jgi:hypothetical protein
MRPQSSFTKQPVVIVSQGSGVFANSKIGQKKITDSQLSTESCQLLNDSQFIIPDTPVEDYGKAYSSGSGHNARKVAGDSNGKAKIPTNVLPPRSDGGKMRIRVIGDDELVPLSEYPVDFWENLSRGKVDMKKTFAKFFENL